ncbi:LLM class F420-dependent oxidoreductase [Sphingomonas sp. G-3-2-10]|uniref:LLM class F420-dependent oxidoreductase n=1 Tax=Sphingomonas sp. G-3-2-10 TaxID=2728838 RepID=UPI00146D04C7|nr:LLM class F420-dependent oxidoreductase [Sphingomonas sp. G-3-2-10]NML08421.1 LLM class F420-dependent oxidoreductase [Sphingomonas sp. G-3-2-10]
MRISLHLPIEDVSQPDEFLTGEAVSSLARAIEASGADACYVTDHPFPAEGWINHGGHHALDPFVALSFAAAATTRLKLHTHLIVLAYRNPFLTAKSVASIDRLSDGRLIMGVGVGYMQQEFAALGVDFTQRGKLVDEALAAMKAAWTGEAVAFEGLHFNAPGNIARPAPLQRPHPPIWAGGNSALAIRRAVNHCDGWAPFPAKGKLSAITGTDDIATIDDLRIKIDYAMELRGQAGITRPFDVCMVPFKMMMGHEMAPTDAILEQLHALAAIGVTWSAIALPAPSRAGFIENVERFGAEVIAKLPGRT